MTVEKNKGVIFDKAITNSIIDFFESVEELKKNEIIRSSKFTADIAEYICSKLFDLKLCSNQREIGYDAFDIEGNEVQIKINNSSEKTNQDIGDKTKYKYLILVVTSNSKMFNIDYLPANFLIYKINCSELRSDKYIAKNFIGNLTPDFKLSSKLEIIQ
jgi:hypothetical protein